MKKEKVEFYEVVEGNIVSDHQYTGIILRDERVEQTDRAGYIKLSVFFRGYFNYRICNITAYVTARIRNRRKNSGRAAAVNFNS